MHNGIKDTGLTPLPPLSKYFKNVPWVSQAFLDRGEIRDCFDIEFILRRGTALPFEDKEKCIELQKKIVCFKDVDFKVKLGSILEKDIRDYYVENRFSFLEEKLTAMISNSQIPPRKS